jgi:hypothetical protein
MTTHGTMDGAADLEFGDGTRRYRLAIGQLRELQEKTGRGPIAILARIISGEWFVDEVREPIRLGLIGGGANPIEALRFVERYVDPHLAEAAQIARAVLGAAVLRPLTEDEPPGKRKRARGRRSTGSPSPASTATGS